MKHWLLALVLLMPVAQRGASVVPTGNPTTGFNLTIPAVQVGDWLELPFTSKDHTAVTGMPTVTDTDTLGETWTVTALSLDRKALIARKRAGADTAGKVITVAGCVGSTSGVLKCWSGTDTAASPVTNEVTETNISGDEAHAGFTPDNASSMLCAAIFNTGNDNAVTALTFATAGATTMTEKLSTGGGDCATAFGHVLQSGGPSATGGLTWAQTNGTTYSHTWALKPASNPLITADPGAYSVTGTAASLEVNREVAAVAGAYAIAGTAASLEANREVAADPGAYDVTGVAASLRAALKMIADGGAYVIDGVAATLRISKTLTAESGGYSITGSAAGFSYDRVMPADPGAVAIDGTPAELLRVYRMDAEAGSYQITGTPARATLSLDVLPSSATAGRRVIVYDKV